MTTLSDLIFNKITFVVVLLLLLWYNCNKKEQFENIPNNVIEEYIIRYYNLETILRRRETLRSQRTHNLPNAIIHPRRRRDELARRDAEINRLTNSLNDDTNWLHNNIHIYHPHIIQYTPQNVNMATNHLRTYGNLMNLI